MFVLFSSLPFDWKTPRGYVFAYIFEITAFYCSQFVFLPVFGFYLGFCWLIISFVKDIANDLDQLTLNECQSDNDQTTGVFCEIVELYSEVKQFSHTNQKPSYETLICVHFHFSMVVQFNGIYEFVPTCFILWCLLELCVELFLLQIFLVEFEWWFFYLWSLIWSLTFSWYICRRTMSVTRLCTIHWR